MRHPLYLKNKSRCFASIANAALIGMVAADQGIKSTQYRDFAEKQINYMLGSCNGQSFQVGFGNKFPQQPHHRAS